MHDNVFVSRMIANMVEALEGRYSRKPCAKEIQMELEEFCKSEITLPIKQDGTKKFVPIYALQPIGFKILDSDFEGTIISHQRSTMKYLYQLLPKNNEK